jgi:hypothetical protein
MNYFTEEINSFYSTQSAMSDPGCYTHLLDSWSFNLQAVKQIIHGLLFHFSDAAQLNQKISLARLADLDTRTVEAMLQKIIKANDRPLVMGRGVNNKLLGCCREFSMLACTILRHHGLAARVRVVFNTYYKPDIFNDQVIVEFWDKERYGWRSLDMRMTAAHLKKLKITFEIDFFDLPCDKYIPAAVAWFLIRDQPECAHKFGSTPDKCGLWYIRDRLLQDFAALNKVEMLIWDCWGMMNTAEEKMSEKDLLLLDKIARMLLEPDVYFNQIRDLYESNMLLKVPEKILSFSPSRGKRMVDVSKLLTYTPWISRSG